MHDKEQNSVNPGSDANRAPPGMDVTQKFILNQVEERTSGGDDPVPSGNDARSEAVRTNIPPGIDATRKLNLHSVAEKAAVTAAPVKTAGSRLCPDTPWCRELWQDLQVYREDAFRSADGGLVAPARNPHIRRDITVKILDSENPSEHELRKFYTEARILSQLEHPSIIPVHAMGNDEYGQPFYVMKKQTGRTLTDVLAEVAAHEGADAERFDIVALLLIFNQICAGIGFAHKKGVIHGCLDTDTIIIGDFGEVIITHWNTCRLMPGHKIILDPEALPGQIEDAEHVSERAAKKILDSDPRTDIYDLGRLFCSILTLRGRAPAAERLHRIPATKLPHCHGHRLSRTLQAIAMKATSADISQRYQNADDFRADIDSFLHGRPLQAEQKNRLRQAWLLLLRKRNLVFIALLALLALLAAGTLGTSMLYQHRLETARWGPPVTVERFADDQGWRRRWQVAAGKLSIHDGGLLTQAGSGDEFLFFFNEKLHGPTSIEFECEIVPGAQIGDFAVVWSEEMDLANCLLFQTGAGFNTTAGITRRKNGVEQQFESSSFMLQPERKYQVRVFLESGLYTLWVNDRKICEYQDVIPFYSGYAGIQARLPGKVFSSIRIRSKGVPEQVDSLFVADVLLKRGNYQRAVLEYENIEKSHSGKMVAWQAAYKRGLAHFLNEHHQEAYTAWQRLLGTPMSIPAEIQMLNRMFQENAHNRVMQDMADIHRRADVLMQRQLAMQWNRMAAGILDQDWRLSRTYGNLGLNLFGNEQNQAMLLARLLLRQGRYEEALSYCSVQSEVLIDMLLKLGRPAELGRRCPDMLQAQLLSLMHQGQYDEITTDYKRYGAAAAPAWLLSGRAHELAAVFPDSRQVRAQALLFLGQYEELLRDYPEQHRLCAEALLRSGNPELVLEKYPGEAEQAVNALRMLGQEKDIAHIYPEQRQAAAYALLAAGQAREVAENYPDQREPWVQAMHLLGLTPRLLEMFPENRTLYAECLLRLGNFEELLRDYPEQQRQAAQALLEQRLFDNVLLHYADSHQECAYAFLFSERDAGSVAGSYPGQRQVAALELLLQGEYQELRRRYPEQRELCGLGVLKQNGPAAALKIFPEQHNVRLLARAALALQRSGRGMSPPAEVAVNEFRAVVRAGLEPQAAVLLPLLEWLFRNEENDFDPVQAYQELRQAETDVDMQRLKFSIGVILDEMADTEFMQQPARRGASSRLSLAKAVRAELEQNRLEAVRFYQEYVHSPPRLRGLLPLTDIFVEWRLQVLAESNE